MTYLLNRGTWVNSKVDLVMWAKNGERFLPLVLNRISQVIPDENVNQKIFVDDHSTDKSREIAREFNWTVYPNREGGIPNGANEALRHVNSEFFVSIEQDIVLAKDWWERIPPYMVDSKVAVAQGLRFSTNPTLRKFEEYVLSRKEPDWFHSIDNNIFRTNVIRQLGGFPTDHPAYVDSVLRRKIVDETSYKWIVDKTVVSKHIRENIDNYIEHERLLHARYHSSEDSFLKLLRLFATSPARGLIIAFKKREPSLLWIYTRSRWVILEAYLER
jgi:glycosyltransferase involved in cell wall biosynthesis